MLLLIATLSSSSIADERTFEEHCARCHQRAISLARRLKEQTVEERSAALDRFLETHHAQDPQVRAAVIEYLMGLSAR